VGIDRGEGSMEWIRASELYSCSGNRKRKSQKERERDREGERDRGGEGGTQKTGRERSGRLKPASCCSELCEFKFGALTDPTPVHR